MAIGSISYGNIPLSQSILSLKSQMTDLQSQLTTGQKSTNYSGMGSNEGFAIAARTQLSNISAFTNTITNVTTRINAANTALQSISQIATNVQSAATSGSPALNGAGQTSAQQGASAQLSSLVGMLNTQAGDTYLFSGSAINTPSVVSADSILNGNGAQVGLTQLISERNQADLGAASPSLGRLAISPSATTPITVSEDVAGSPFGLKLNAVTSTLTGATVTGPAGSPAGVSIALGATNPNSGDKINLTLNLPDGSTQTVQLTATTTTPVPTGSFAIDPLSTANTSANLNAALNTAISTVASTSLVAASAVAASNNFFDLSGTATGSVQNNKAAAPITGATLLSGAASTDSLSTNFASGDTITVNGTPITFVASGATGNQLNITDSIQTLLSKVDSLTGATNPSTISGGVITLHGGTSTNLTVSSSNSAAFAALGFGAAVNAAPAPLRVGGTPLSSATTLVAATPANTVSWYTGADSASPRASQTARIDQSQTVQYGAQADESALTSILKTVALLAAVTTSPTNPNATAQIKALNERVATNLTPQPGRQKIQDIQTDFANAQTIMQDVTAQQTQAKATLQTVISDTETVSTDQVASELLALQTSLQASYQATSMLSQLSLTKFL